IRDAGYTIEGLTTGLVLDPDIGLVDDDAAAPLVIDGAEILVVWDSDFFASSFDGTPGFLAIVPLGDPVPVVTTQLENGLPPDRVGVQDVPQEDAAQYRTMVGAAPNDPTIRPTGFDLRALIAWGRRDLPIGSVHRAAAAVVFAETGGSPPSTLEATDDLDPDDPVLANLVAAVRSARATYDQRLADLPPLLAFPGVPEAPTEGEGDRVFQNYPNPFHDQTTVEYNVVQGGRVRIDVLDVTGSLVRTLVDRSTPAGRHATAWDGTSSSGLDVPPGIYVIRMTIDGGGETSVRALKRP
ncbi:MAG: FlgD immunoglobulin-like domain containing protein, partial [Gemmatimonadota bacterium]|nr:FlgD immunoglobulin-like domain containing protein [Gemmatimonadota bacterium]